MNEYIIIFVVMVFVSCCSQILLKISASKKYDSRIKEYLNIYVIFGYSIFFIVAFVNAWAMKGIELKLVPVLEATGYIFVLLLSLLVLKEKINKNKIIGNIIIIIGIIVFTL